MHYFNLITISESFFIKSRTKKKIHKITFHQNKYIIKSVMRAWFKKGKCNEIDSYRTTIVCRNKRTMCYHFVVL